MNIDFMNPNSSQGEVAGMIANSGQFNIGAMRPFVDRKGRACISTYMGGDPNDVKNYKVHLVDNATLRRDEWKHLDDAIVPIAENRLNGIQDLISKGLVYNLGNAMGTTVLEWHDVSDAMEASLTMDGVTRSQGDRPVFTTNYLPIPIIHVDYEINARVLAASRSLGNPLDTTSAERAARKIALQLEQMLFTDTDYTFGGGSIKSYLNYTNRNTVTLDSKWDNSGVTGAEIVADVLSLKQASMDNFHYGPWMLYVPSSYETTLDADYSTAKGSNTIRERIMKIANIQGIKVVDTLTADNVLLVQMTPDVVRLVRGMGITNVQWSTEGKFVTKYKVMTIQVPQIRSDQAGKCGVTHATFTA
jgi:uncharacterized linocin/CFP29 family protein